MLDAGRSPRTAAITSVLLVDAVVEDEERQAEDRERVLGSQLAVLDVDVELLGEPADLEGRELAGVGIDVGEVVAGMVVAVVPAVSAVTSAASAVASAVAGGLAPAREGQPSIG